VLEVSGDTIALAAAEERREFLAFQGLTEFVEHRGQKILQILLAAECFPPRKQVVDHFEAGRWPS